MKNQRHMLRVTRRGFTLIEVLIAVLVLSLGLLGLGAVFPTVIAQQRDAVDRTQGAVIAKVVEQTLEQGQYLVQFNGLRRDFWFSAQQELGCGEGFDLESDEMSYLWEPSWSWGPPNHMVGNPGADYLNFGTISVGTGQYLDFGCTPRTPDPDDSSDDDRWDEPYYVPVTARLFPQPYTGEEPQYVWDFVARRVRGVGTDSGLELAVFIRRIDPRIRVPRGKTLSDVLTGNGVALSEVRLPVGMDPSSGLPSGDGTGVYSVPLTLPAIVQSPSANGQLDQIVLDPGASAAQQDLWRRVVGVPGQILVDNLGNVLHVTRVIEQQGAGDSLRVAVDHRYAAYEADFVQGSTQPRGTQVEQIMFTPQKPVRVLTFRASW